MTMTVTTAVSCDGCTEATKWFVGRSKESVETELRNQGWHFVNSDGAPTMHCCARCAAEYAAEMVALR